MFDDGTLMLRQQINQSEHEEIMKTMHICLEHNLASEIPRVIRETKAAFESLREEYRKRGIMI